MWEGDRSPRMWALCIALGGVRCVGKPGDADVIRVGIWYHGRRHSSCASQLELPTPDGPWNRGHTPASWTVPKRCALESVRTLAEAAVKA